MVRREFDENGGVTKTVTTTTTEEREYKVINYDDDGGGGDLDEAISADMAELDDLRQLAAASAASASSNDCETLDLSMPRRREVTPPPTTGSPHPSQVSHLVHKTIT